MVRFAACVALWCLFATSLMAGPSKSAAALNSLAEEYMRAFYGFSPSLATRAGVHQYDSQMEDLWRESFEKQIAAYTEFEKKFAALPTAGLSEAEAADREMMQARVRGGLFD